MADGRSRAGRRLLGELAKRGKTHRVQAEIDIETDLARGERSLADATGRVFGVAVSADQFTSIVGAVAFPAGEEPWQQGFQAKLSGRSATQTDAELRVWVSHDPPDEAEISFRREPTPPAALLDPAIRGLEQIAADLIGDAPANGSKRGRLIKDSSHGEIKLRLAVGRSDAVAAVREAVSALNEYRGPSATSLLRLERVPLGAGVTSVLLQVQATDLDRVCVRLRSYTSDPQTRVKLGEYLDRVVTLLQSR